MITNRHTRRPWIDPLIVGHIRNTDVSSKDDRSKIVRVINVAAVQLLDQDSSESKTFIFALPQFEETMKVLNALLEQLRNIETLGFHEATKNLSVYETTDSLSNFLGQDVVHYELARDDPRRP